MKLDRKTHDAFNRAYTKYAASINISISRQLQSMKLDVDVYSVAEDITQEAFEKTFTSKNIQVLIQHEESGQNSLIAFLRTVANNLAIDYARKFERKMISYDRPIESNGKSLIDVIDESNLIAKPLPLVYSDQLRAWIYRALLEIHKGNAEKATYILHILDYRFDGMQWDLIARELGKNLSTVKKDWERSRGPLLAKLKDEGIL